ncbi:ABC transporter ATP-binding protein [Nonomuraea sp. NPDC052265]|uniref:ABC transporter ATP-binding protein n=1 Tax=Nonomuraea sp. NPDC052265 TaxID=3364374 RepID=UPI0037C645C9
MIVLADVSRTYPGGVAALDSVSLEIRRGERVAIVGPSGSGKSTMLNIVGTLDRPSAGRIEIDGYDVAKLSDNQLSALRATTIGFVFQHFHLAAKVTALDNVADGLIYTGLPLAERRRRAGTALRRVGLGHRIDHEPHELSGGERQRVAIARAVAGDPPLLLADEPTGALDSVSGTGVMDLLHELNGSGTTIVIITHDREIAAGLPRQVSMRDGRIVSDSGPRTASHPHLGSGSGPGPGPRSGSGSDSGSDSGSGSGFGGERSGACEERVRESVETEVA